VRVLSPSESGEEVRKGCRRVNIVQYCVHMYVSGKMIPVEIVHGMGEGGE
jgi:hypothetical protein